MDVDGPATFSDGLTEDERADLEQAGHRKTVRRSEVLFRESEPSDHVLVVTAGQISVGRSTQSGRTVTLAIRGVGDLVGELGALEGAARSATAVAATDAEVLVVPAAAFQQFLTDHPRAGSLLWHIAVARLREASERQVEFVSQDAVGRVCARLVVLSDRRPAAAATVVALPGGQQELGSWCGLTREATARALATLRRLGWIRTEGRRIHLLQPAAIRARGLV
jgi:CRP-like cAMP-binding protein